MFCYPSHTKVEPICKSTIRDKFQLHLRAIIPVSGKPSRIRSVGARKETYATTGSRIKLRFFGGWDFTEGDLSDNYAQAGYDKGVPMGGDLKAATADAPSFIVHAMMDPESGSLDRVQIIKGWVNADGSLGEKVYDAAWSGDRKMDANGKVPSVGNSITIQSPQFKCPLLIIRYDVHQKIT